MSTPFQNRLVGSIIVAAAAVIFLPDILDGEKQKYQADFETIPQAPKVIDKVNPPEFPNEKLTVLETKSGDTQAQIKEQIYAASDKVSEQLSEDTTTETVKITPLNKDDEISTPANTEKAQAASSNNSEAEQWVIQLGSYQHEKNVRDLVDTLKANGYPVFVKPIKTKNGVLTKVFVGPELIKGVLEKQLPKIEQLTKAQGKISQYN